MEAGYSYQWMALNNMSTCNNSDYFLVIVVVCTRCLLNFRKNMEYLYYLMMLVVHFMIVTLNVAIVCKARTKIT